MKEGTITCVLSLFFDAEHICPSESGIVVNARERSGDFNKYEELEKRNGIVADENEAMNILSIVGRRSWNNDDKNSLTVHSVVYNLTDKTVTWVGNENYSDPDAVYTFSLE